MSKKLIELELEITLLPERETLWFNYNYAAIYASNSSLAVNAGNWGMSGAQSTALQNVQVSQH